MNNSSSLSVQNVDFSQQSVCQPAAMPSLRELIMVAVFGTCIAAVCVVENILLVFVLTTRKTLRTSNLIYLNLLAFFDIFIGVSYIAIMTVQILMDWTQSGELNYAWHTYFRPMFTLSHITLATSSFLIVTATLERFLTARHIGTVI